MMTAVRQPEAPFAANSQEMHENENGIQVERSHPLGPQDSEKKADEDGTGLDSGSSDHEAPKEFKEGGNGWYVQENGVVRDKD